MNPSVLRLVRFGTAGAGFDAALRDRVAKSMELPGLRAVIAGRMGPGQDGPRLVATVWTSRAAMDASIEAASAVTLADPAALPGTPRDFEVVLPVAVDLEATIDAQVAIIRVVRGVTKAGELKAYLEDARGGLAEERSTGRGPLALYLGVDPPDRFVTLSLWGGWSHVEATTGADHEHVERTRFAERLATWTAEHYEAVPGLGLVRPGA